MKSDPETILRRHVVNVTRAFAEFREEPARNHSPSSQGYHFNKDMPNRSTEQTRLSVYNWNLGLRRGKKGAIERHIAGKLHIITSQEAIEYLEHDFLTNRFHVTHYGGCAILFNKDTFFSDNKVSSTHLHDTGACEQDKITEGGSGWVLQGVGSRAAFRRQPCSGQKSFTVMSLARKRGIGKKLLLTIRAVMLEEHVDLVTGDINGAAWCQSNSNNPQPTSIIEEAFCRHRFSDAAWPHTVVRPRCSTRRMERCELFVKPRTLVENGRSVCMELSQFSARPSASVQKIKVATLDLVGNQYAHESRGKHEQRVLLKERSCPYPLNKEKGRYDGESDCSLSSMSSVRELMQP